MNYPWTCLALDPGSEKSAVCLLTFTGKKTLLEPPLTLHWVEHLPNEEVCNLIEAFPAREKPDAVACEGMRTYMLKAYKEGQIVHVGTSVFDTCEWIGMFRHACKIARLPFSKLFRPDIANLIAYDPRAKTPALRQALEDRFGKVGTGKSTAGPLFALRGHSDHGVSALAVGVAYHDRLVLEEKEREREAEKARCRDSALA